MFISPNSYQNFDSEERLLQAWNACLERLEEMVIKYKWESIAFPYNIGCGMGGYAKNWPKYKQEIDAFSEKVCKKCQVYIVRKE